MEEWLIALGALGRAGTGAGALSAAGGAGGAGGRDGGPGLYGGAGSAAAAGVNHLAFHDHQRHHHQVGACTEYNTRHPPHVTPSFIDLNTKHS